jgi:Glycosyltransferase 61
MRGMNLYYLYFFLFVPIYFYHNFGAHLLMAEKSLLLNQRHLMVMNPPHHCPWSPPLILSVDIRQAVCALDDKNMVYVYNLYHVAQSLLPCWSFFQRVKEAWPEATCTFWLSSQALQRPREWQLKLIESMNCSLTQANPTSVNGNTLVHYNDKNVCPGQYCTIHIEPNPVADHEPRYDFFERPEDAIALRKQVLGDVANNETNRLKIGLVDRRSNQKVLNIQEIESEIFFPNAAIELMFMEDMHFEEQARWWSEQNVVVGAHGAAYTNMIFMPVERGAAIVQIFPHDYYPIYFFQSLANTTGVHAYFWADSDDPLGNNAKPKKQKLRAIKKNNINPPVDDITSLVKKNVDELTPVILAALVS